MLQVASTPTPATRTKVRRGPCGLHLFDRHSGLNILLNDISVPEADWHMAPRHVSIALTNACDLSCGYCYAPKHASTQNYHDILAWADELDANGSLGIGFGGGEPTLYKKLPDLCRYIAEKTSLAVSLTTHGHNLSPALAEQLKGHVHFVRVSVDGVGSTYERLRGRRFRDLEERLRAVKALAPFGINVVVNSETICELDAVVNFASSVGAKELLLLPEQPSNTSVGVNDVTRSKLLTWVCEYRGQLPLCVSEQGAERMPVFEPLSNETGLLAYAHVDASGTLKRDSFASLGVPVSSTGMMAALAALKSRVAEDFK